MTIQRTAAMAIFGMILAGIGSAAQATPTSAAAEEADAGASAARLDGQGRVVLSFEPAPARPRHRPDPAMAAARPAPAHPVARHAHAPRVAHKGAAEAWAPAMAVAPSHD